MITSPADFRRLAGRLAALGTLGVLSASLAIPGAAFAASASSSHMVRPAYSQAVSWNASQLSAGGPATQSTLQAPLQAQPVQQTSTQTQAAPAKAKPVCGHKNKSAQSAPSQAQQSAPSQTQQSAPSQAQQSAPTQTPVQSAPHKAHKGHSGNGNGWVFPVPTFQPVPLPIPMPTFF